ncbi:MAG: ATP-binding cassette domain-containing protein [Pseudomonadota bacterium]
MAAHALQIEGLTVTARKGGRILLEVPSLEVAPGTSLGVRGPSGAGKSTLLYALAGLAPKMSGHVRWGAEDLCQMSASQRTAFRAQNIGMIFQDFLLFEELSAGANAALTAAFAPRQTRAALRDRAAAHLTDLGIAEPARHVDGFSGGERQRVAVARAIAAGAPILLADEPTASLQRAAADMLSADLVRHAGQHGQTLIVVSHDDGLLDRMDRVIDLRDGRVA